MTLNDYIKTIDFPLLKMTVTYPSREGRVLLAKKIKQGGLGEGNFLGIGGKVNPEESFEESALREVKEEIGIQISELTEMATVYFYFPHKEAKEMWNMEMKVFTAEKWKGEPHDTDEMQPRWFKKDTVPFDSMWDDAHYWLPYVLEDKRLEAHCMYGEDNKTVEEFSIRFLS